jgi:predicted dienelactone hydrolase
MAANWDAVAAAAGEGITSSEDGLWQPITDERIRAVMPMAPDGAWIYGDKGLAAADRPALMVQASKDSPYQPAEGKFIFENLGAPEKGMVSFIGRDHFMIMDPKVEAKIRHLTVAFLGYHLQGREDYQQHFSQDFISQFDDLAWGFYEEE